ncbi:MAG: hypothetical protein DHS20C01_01280 [marine bacterium B5-7]|nr:MAG: hypothetical protein DHS20C01_01280 [marine bacterium B5-7]
MKWIFATWLLLAADVSLARDANGVYIPKGDIDCETFILQYDLDYELKRQALQVRTEFIRIESWINGYLTAVNKVAQNGKRDIAQGKNMEFITEHISKYCRKNRSSSLASAMEGLLIELLASPVNN